jgi:hypothetical protein
VAGRTKVKLYHYSNVGKYLGEIECMADVHRKYYGGAHYPLFRSDRTNTRNQDTKDYHELPDGTFVAKSKIGRDGLKKRLQLDNDPFARKDDSTYVVEVFSVSGRKLAEFASLNVAQKLMGRDIHQRIDRTYLKAKDSLIFKSKK